MPKVSVVIPNYNHAKYLPARMDSIFNQTYKDFEVIILDDSSGDNSLQVLEAYRVRPQVSHFLVNERNSGSPFRQWKKGIDCAAGEYIWIAESDDFAAPTFLERLVPVLDSDPAVGIAFSDIFLANADGQVVPRDVRSRSGQNFWASSFRMEGIEAIRRLLVVTNSIPNASAVLFRKSVFDQIPETYLSFRFNGDWLVWISLLQHCSLYFLAEKLSYFRFHQHTTRVAQGKGPGLERLKERYMIANTVQALGADPGSIQILYDKLARKLLNLVGIRKLLFDGLHEIRSFARYDRQLYGRMLRMAVGRMFSRPGIVRNGVAG